MNEEIPWANPFRLFAGAIFYMVIALGIGVFGIWLGGTVGAIIKWIGVVLLALCFKGVFIWLYRYIRGRKARAKWEQLDPAFRAKITSYLNDEKDQVDE